MITLITGSPGGGKSLYVVSRLIPDFLLSGRHIYTNLKGLDYSGFDKHGNLINLVKTKDNIPVSDLISPLPDDFDWRGLPDGSVVIYDEAQQAFPASGRSGLSNDGRIVDLDTHRHRGFDLVFITQHPTLISSHIRKFVGLHAHLYRKWGGSYSSLYVWNHCNSSPEFEIGEEQRSEKQLFRFPKKAYSYYKSSELHTVKFKMPRKFFVIIFLLFSLFLGVGVLGYIGFNKVVGVYKGDHLRSYSKDVVIDRPNFKELF